jgi:hypothetical protein
MSGTLRPTEQNDLPALSKFLVRAYEFDAADFHFDLRVLEWKYLFPRAIIPGCRSFILERDGSIVAHAGLCPVSFRLPAGEIVISQEIVDWAADPATPGLGVMIYRKLMQMAPASFVVGGAPVTRKIVPRMGFRHIAEAPTYAAWLRPWQEFQTRRPRTLRSFLRLLHGVSHPVRNRTDRGPGFESVPVTAFDNSIQPVLNTSRPWTVCQRSVADLNYLLQCPHLKIRAFLLKREGMIRGYFVLAKSTWEGRILDISIDSNDANDWTEAYSAVTTAALLDPEICRIRTLATVPLLNQALQSSGYWCQYKDPIVLYDPNAKLTNALPLSFQYADGDWGF